MKKWILTLLAAAFLLVTPVFAAGEVVADEGQLLSSHQAAQLTDALYQLQESYHMDVVVVTTNSLYGKNPSQYADDFYDENGYGADGILLLVSTEDNDWYISTSGAGIRIFNDDCIDYMADQFIPYFSEGEFFEGFLVFAQLCDDILLQNEIGEAPTYKAPFQAQKYLLGCAIGAIVIALIVVLILKAQLKSVRPQSAAADYVVSGSLNLTQCNDFFLYHTVNRVEKPKNNGGTHMSSGGHSHGGHGGKF